MPRAAAQEENSAVRSTTARQGERNISLQRGTWLLLWPAAALLVVAAGYLALGPAVFQKHGGCHSLAARWLLAPYLVGAWISYRLYTRGRQPFSPSDIVFAPTIIT